jgi:hypothetical protein
MSSQSKTNSNIKTIEPANDAEFTKTKKRIMSALAKHQANIDEANKDVEFSRKVCFIAHETSGEYAEAAGVFDREVLVPTRQAREQHVKEHSDKYSDNLWDSTLSEVRGRYLEAAYDAARTESTRAWSEMWESVSYEYSAAAEVMSALDKLAKLTAKYEAFKNTDEVQMVVDRVIGQTLIDSRTLAPYYPADNDDWDAANRVMNEKHIQDVRGQEAA